MLSVVKKGSHYSEGLSIRGIHYGRSAMNYNVAFDGNCLIVPARLDCQSDWNKLYGWSYGLHQSNSIRICWRSRLGKIQIGAYLYENGKRRVRYINSVDVYKGIDTSIYHDKELGVVQFRVGDKFWSTNWYGSVVRFGYDLGLYYGGNCPAPETIQVEYD